MNQRPPTDAAVEIASVLVVVQASFSLVAGLSSLPFAIIEPGFRVLGVLTLIIAAAMFWLARNLRRGRRWAWGWLVTLELLSLAMTTLLALLPIGTIRGPLPLLVNLVIPVSVVVLLAAASDARGAASGRAPARERVDGGRYQQDQAGHDELILDVEA